MIITPMERTGVYPAIDYVFKNLNITPKVLELGVLRGINAKNISNSINLSSLTVVDEWAPYSVFKNMKETDDTFQSTCSYFSGDPRQQQTFDNLFEECKRNLGHVKDLTLLKSSVNRAYQQFVNDKLKFDFIYIDANHEYESVLEDLYNYQNLLTDDGIIMLDDFVDCELSRKQNCGVVKATMEFIKETDYEPCIITAAGTDWSNLVISKNPRVDPLIEDYFSRNKLFSIRVDNQIINQYTNSISENFISFKE